MQHQKILSEMEELVLLTILNLDGEAYGVPIQKRVAEKTGYDVAIGTIYVTLERLENQGFVTSRIGKPSAERGGRAKKFFKISGAGTTALDNMERMRQALRGNAPVLQPSGA